MSGWVPSSPCGPRCLPPAPPRTGICVAALRGAALAAGLALVALPMSAGLRRRWSRAMLACLGVRLSVRDHRLRRPGGRGVLVVAGHVSWIDVLALGAVAPVSFVARADLLAWGPLGRLARRMRVIPIDRANLRALPAAVDAVRGRLAAGEFVAAFPEATTWCGRAYGRLRPAMFQAAVDAQCPVQPIAVRYTDAAGSLCTGPSFVGAETMAAAMRRALRQRGIVAQVRLAPLEEPGTCRRELAARCERAVRGEGELTRVAQ